MRELKVCVCVLVDRSMNLSQRGAHKNIERLVVNGSGGRTVSRSLAWRIKANELLAMSSLVVALPR